MTEFGRPGGEELEPISSDLLKTSGRTLFIAAFLYIGVGLVFGFARAPHVMDPSEFPGIRKQLDDLARRHNHEEIQQ